MGCTLSPALIEARQSLQIGYLLFGVLFLFLCVFPLIKLAGERCSLYILISKLFPALLVILCLIFGLEMVHRLFPVRQTVRQTLSTFGFVSNRLHIVALAVNRAHAVFFPFHYSQKISTKVVLLQCLFIHLLSAVVGVFVIFYPIISFYTWPYLIVSSSIYVAVAIRLVCIKVYQRNQNWGQTSEKDNGRITAIFFAIQTQAWAYVVINALSNYKWYSDFINCHPVGQVVFFPVQFVLAMYSIGDELFLLMLCKEMRVLFVQMVGKLLPFIKMRNTTAEGQSMAQSSTQPISQMKMAQHSRKLPNVNTVR